MLMAAAENAEDLTGVAIGSVSMSSGYCFLQSVFTESSMQIFRSQRLHRFSRAALADSEG